MKKTLRKIIYILLSAVLCFCFSACNKKEKKDDDSIHIDNTTETNEFLLKDGATDYKIVLPAGSGELMSFAAGEFTDLFGEATGVTLETITDENLTYSDDSKIISLGRTAPFSGSGVTAGSELTSTGYVIRTAGKSIYVCGGGETGTLNGVYGLLNKMFGYEFFARDCYKLEKSVRDVKLMNYDIKEVPDFEFNAGGYGYINNDTFLQRRLRMVNYTSLFGWVNGGLMHNSFNWIDYDTYYETHRSWFSTATSYDKLQLCYTARGDQSEYEQMVEVAVESLQKTVIGDPTVTRVILAHQDSQTWCECEACAAELNKYKANSATVVKFINRIMEKMEAWFEAEGAEYKRDLKLYLLAYHQTNASPVTYNEKTDTYAPVDDSVRMRDDVGVWFAETNGDFVIPFTQGLNEQFAKNMRGWAALTDNLMFWNYSSSMNYYLAPYNSFNAMQPNYKFAKENKSSLMFDQASTSENGAASAWAALKVYLSSKLAWNVNADMESLIDTFFDAYFGPAAGSMREWFENYRTHAAFIENKKGFGGSRSIFINSLSKEKGYWPKPVLDGWMANAAAAIDSIASLEKSDPAQYSVYYDRIALERVSPIYITVEMYEPQLTMEKAAEYKTLFYEDTQRLGMTHSKESFDSENISAVYKKWGIN